tara:strand:+ start:3082 stop:4512 length:1431 start_codon:yes stop_codon:yes gene_type:complete
MNFFNNKTVQFICGSQHLYGDQVIDKVEINVKEIIDHFNKSDKIPALIKFKKVLTTPDEITKTCLELNNDENCIGVIIWMHTFSPAKMWISGLKKLTKPICHLHTQFNTEIPWDSINMDFMNLNQSAHGDREFAHLLTRMKISRKVAVGHWKEEYVKKEIGVWSRSALGWDEIQNLKVARIGDNMRDVAVTEGDKLEAHIKFGFSVNGYDSDDISSEVDFLDEEEVNSLIEEYQSDYDIAPKLQRGGTLHSNLIDAAKIELGIKNFLEKVGCMAFTTTFENLGGLKQLPGISVQRLMKMGYGFAAEGDWKTAALLRAMKVMASGLDKGTSFMEDYTYHFGSKKPLVLGSHMLEVCPSISDSIPRCEIHPLSIGNREDPVRLVFNAKTGEGINACLVDMGEHFRMIVNEVKSVKIDNKLPRLPVARALLDVQPNFIHATRSWMLAGGSHHTVFSLDLNIDHLNDFCEMAGIECVRIN